MFLAFPSEARAQRSDRREVLILGLLSALVFVALVPFAKRQLPEIRTFIPTYQAALAVTDLVTAALLYWQFALRRSYALLLLATAYLFAALMAIVHVLTFPGLFAPEGLLGAGPQTTAWLYMFWHGGFPAMVVAYGLVKDRERGMPSERLPALAIMLSVLAVVAAVALLTLIATSTSVPAIMVGNNYTHLMVGVVTAVWACSMAGFMVLWLRMPYSVLDMWLMLVMLAWMFDIALAAVFNAGRFDLGFYTGRIYGLVASTLVLGVLLRDSLRKA